MKKKKYQNVRIISKVNIKIKINFPGLVQLLTVEEVGVPGENH
jgi:hypothetical protein